MIKYVIQVFSVVVLYFTQAIAFNLKAFIYKKPESSSQYIALNMTLNPL